jgi:hypothetical protein
MVAIQEGVERNSKLHEEAMAKKGFLIGKKLLWSKLTTVCICIYRQHICAYVTL